jgi:hypothetical protein
MTTQTRIENKRLIATFMEYANGKPLTDSLLNSLYNDWNSIIPVIQEIKAKAKEINYVDMVGLEQRLNPFNYELVSIVKGCVEFIKTYNITLKN